MNGQFSAVSTSCFYNNRNTDLTGYEYWFDENHGSGALVGLTPGQFIDLSAAVTTDSLTAGMHTLHFRFRNAQGRWSGVTSDVFYKHGGSGNQSLVNKYEYWFDDNPEQRETVFINPDTISELIIPLNAMSLPTGLHRLHFRFSSSDLASVTTTDYFFKNSASGPGETTITGYRFWFDSNMSTMRTISLSQPSAGLILLDSLTELPYLPLGKHLMNIDFKDASGKYSSIVSDSILVTICTPYPAHPITGFQQVCPGRTGVAYTIPAITNATGYLWSIPSGATIVSGANSPSIIVDYSMNVSSGVISVQGINPCGTGPASTLAIEVTPSPVISFTGDTVVCTGAAGIIYTAEPGYPYYSWSITGGEITSGSNSSTITVNWGNTPGNQMVTVQYHTAEGCSGTSSKTIFIRPLPPASQIIPGMVIQVPQTYCGEATNLITVPEQGETFTIASGGSAFFLAGAKIRLRPGFSVEQGGYLHAYINEDCFYCNSINHTLPQTPEQMVIKESFPSNSAAFSQGSLSFTVIPNPTDGEFMLMFDRYVPETSMLRIEIFTMQGIQLLDSEIKGGLKSISHSLAEYPSGTYLIRLISDYGTGTARIIKK
jgi:hypothetical protein